MGAVWRLRWRWGPELAESTRLLASEEADLHPEYTRQVLASSENDTVHLNNLFDGGWPEAPHRVIRNSTVTTWEAAGCPRPGERPGEGEVVARSKSGGDILRYACQSPPTDASGNVEALSMWAGQTTAMVRRVQPAADIVGIGQARSVMSGLFVEFKGPYWAR